MNKSVFVYSIVLLFIVGCNQHKKEENISEKIKDTVINNIASKFSIEIIDDEALAVIDPKTPIKVLASGFSWTEGPLWIEEGNYLLFSDIPNNKVYKLTASNDTITYLHPSGCSTENFTGVEAGSNGLLMSPEGKLVLLQHGDRKIAMMDAPLSNPEENYINLVDNYKGKRLNSPNDGVFDAHGNLYFTDPPYGLPKQMEDPNKELEYQGVYCLLTTGELVLIDKLTRPNGIALSPDEKTLYVAVSDRKHAVWYSYNVIEPGKVIDKKLFYDCTSELKNKNNKGLPDGMKTNKKGYILATGPGGLWIFNTHAKPIARIYTGQATSNCALSKDEKTLFMTADDYILSVDLK